MKPFEHHPEDRVTITQKCDECGAVVRTPMTIEQARQHASSVLASANGLPPIQLPEENRGAASNN